MSQVSAPSVLVSALPAVALVAEMKALALRALPRMYIPERRIFAFRLRRGPGGIQQEGVSTRYTAIVLLALAQEPEWAPQVLRGDDVDDVCSALIAGCAESADLGEVALTLWAARALKHAGARQMLDRLRRMRPESGDSPTVETAWSLSALAGPGGEGGDPELAGKIARRLINSFNPQSELFSHWPAGARAPWLRSHVTCFADWVYPVQALAYFHRATRDGQALDVARRSADRMCRLQGAAGQWWWHYDVRTGREIEKYPVYAIHQDAMAPMALFAVQDETGQNFKEPLQRSLAWLSRAPETGGSLIDRKNDVIWRKVGRHEPGKLVRRIQALASRCHSSVRVPVMDVLFRPGRVDFESRPYQMGWLLYAWRGERAARLTS